MGKLILGAVLMITGLGFTTFGGFILKDWWEERSDAKSAGADAQPNDVTPEISISAQQRAIAALEELGYGPPKWLDEDQLTGVTNQGLGFDAVQSTQAISSNDNLVIQDIALVKSDGSRLMLRAMVLLNRYSWKKGQHHVFEGESPQGITPLTAISNAEIENEIRSALKIYCVGLSSTEFRADQSDDNTALSDNRAIRLCNALHGLGYIGSIPHRSSIAVGLGERVVNHGEQSNPSRQRTALLVGVTELGEGHTESDVITAIIHGLTAAGIQLDSYRRSDGNLFMMFEVAGQEFTPSTADTWINTPGLSNRRALEAE